MANPFPFVTNSVLYASQLNGIGEASTNYTPTVTAGAGTLTTVTATGGYIRVNKLARVWFSINVTNNGSGSGFLRFTLPFTCVIPIYGMVVGGARESAVNGVYNQVWMESTTTCAMTTSANGYPAANGYQLNGSVIVEVA